MNLIERYVTEVGKRLPRKNRQDIEAELRSTLEDMLEDRARQTGRPADETLVSEILGEYGAPKQVAASYMTRQYLIGPELFPTYTLVVKIVLFAVTLGLTIASLISILGASLSAPELVEELWKFTLSLISALVAAFGNVTLIFAFLERVLPASELSEKESWTPAELTKEPDPDHVSRGEMIFSIILTAALIILLNFYPQLVGIWNNTNGEWTRIAGLSQVFYSYLPWINLSAILTITLNAWLLRREIWDTLTRILHIVLQLIGIAIATAMLRGPSLIVLLPDISDSEVSGILAQLITVMVPVVLLIVIVTSAVEIGKDGIRLLGRTRSINRFN